VSDIIVNALIKIKNADNVAKPEVVLEPVSKLLKNILEILKKEGYIDNTKEVKQGNKLTFIVKLNGNINECRAIKPRFVVGKDDYQKYEKRFLPARDVGTIIVSTNKGLLTHREAKMEKLGGRLIAYVY